MKTELLNRVLQDRKAKRQVALVTKLETGEQALVYPDEVHGELGLGADSLAAVRGAIQDDKSGAIEGPDGELFTEVFNPPLRVIIVGAVHIAQPLARMCAVGGYDVTVVDPRQSFATSERFPGVTLNHEWPDEAIAGLDPDRRTAIITLTHDPKIDDPALEGALKSDAFYIGALGSRKTHGTRLKRLERAGFSEADMARIHGPVGLALGAVSPSEIAVSILAQLTQVLHSKEAA